MKIKNSNKILYDSCLRGDYEGAQLALKGGADMEYRDDEFPSLPLSAVVYHSHMNLVKLLISHEVLVRELSFMIAMDDSDIDMTEALLQGDLSEVDWPILFHKFLIEWNKKEDIQVEVENLYKIREHLSASLKLS